VDRREVLNVGVLGATAPPGAKAAQGAGAVKSRGVHILEVRWLEAVLENVHLFPTNCW
jgi:hypothetical protein